MSKDLLYQSLTKGAIKRMLNSAQLNEEVVLQVIYLAESIESNSDEDRSDNSFSNDSLSDESKILDENKLSDKNKRLDENNRLDESKLPDENKLLVKNKLLGENKSDESKSNAAYKPKYFRRLVLSDGTFAYPICCIKLDRIELDSVSEFELYSLLKVSKYALNVIGNRKMIVLLQFEPLTAGSKICQLLGDPTPFIPDGAPTSPENNLAKQTFILQHRNLISQKGKTSFFKCCKTCQASLADQTNSIYRCDRCCTNTGEFVYCLILSFSIGHPANQRWLQTVHGESMKLIGAETDLDELYDLFTKRIDEFEDLIRTKLANYNRGGVCTRDGRPRQVICSGYKERSLLEEMLQGR